MGFKDKIKELAPSVDELADVMDPLETKEALAPVSASVSDDHFPTKHTISEKTAKSSVKDKIKELTPSIDKLADVMEPIPAKEALTPLQEPVPATITIDPVNRIFGDVMRTVCNIGLLVIIVAAALYFVGINPGDNPNLEVLKWNEPATIFWKDVKGIEVNGYSWFLTDSTDPENAVILGTTILALTPLIGFVFAIPRIHGALRLLLFVITIEFIYAILRPLIMNVGGVG